MRILQSVRTIGACVALVTLIEGCTKQEKPAGNVQTPSKTEQARSRLAAGKEPKCSLAWKAHGHTSEPEAKRFASTCLSAEDGAVDATLSPATVRTKLQALIPPGHALTTIVPADIDVFCPGYVASNKEGRARFWQELLTAIVGPESGYMTKTTLWEVGQGQYSLGLLQLSYNDKNSYRDTGTPGCEFVTEAQVTNPDINLQCGVKIVTKLVKRAQAIGGDQARPKGGAAAYWSTLRMTSKARRPIIAATRSIRVCQSS